MPILSATLGQLARTDPLHQFLTYKSCMLDQPHSRTELGNKKLRDQRHLLATTGRTWIRLMRNSATSSVSPAPW